MSNAKRRAFERLRNYSSAETCREFERASRELIVYTTPRFQRTDLLLEELWKYLCVLFINQRGCMVDSPKVVPNDKKLSCKGTFTKTCSANIKGHRQWQHATLFIRSGVGIVYGDPKEIKHGGDQIMLSGKVLHACVMNRLMDLMCLLSYVVDQQEIARSQAVAVEILRSKQSANLLELAGRMP